MDVVVTIVENNFLRERLEKADYIVRVEGRLARFGFGSSLKRSTNDTNYTKSPVREFRVIRGSFLNTYLKSSPLRISFN